MSNDKVSIRHPEYDALENKRVVIADLRGGTDAMRAKGKAYLPKFPAELDDNYNVRLQTATLFNIYAKTEETMSGLVFKEEPVTDGVSLGAYTQTILENFDNKGTPFTEFAREVLRSAFDGAAAILVDAPNVVEGVTSQEDVNRLGIRPYAVLYPQSCVTNWRYEVNPISKSQEMTLAVLHEMTSEADGAFGWTTVERYRVFRKEVGAPVVFWQVWREVTGSSANDREKNFIVESEGVYPNLKEIPLVVLGELTNAPLMMDLARANVKHYQKESNFDQLEVLAAVPMPWARGRKNADTAPIIAADSFLDLGDDGECGWMQIDSEGFASLRDSLKMLTDQMAMMGLSMLADKTAQVDVTATEALLDNIGDTAELRVMAQDLKDALEKTLNVMAAYLNVSAKQTIELRAAWAVADERVADVSGAMANANGEDGIA